MCMLEVEMSQLLQEIEALRQPMKELNDFIFDHPELGRGVGGRRGCWWSVAVI